MLIYREGQELHRDSLERAGRADELMEGCKRLQPSINSSACCNVYDKEIYNISFIKSRVDKENFLWYINICKRLQDKMFTIQANDDQEPGVSAEHLTYISSRRLIAI
jgi:hypothetical protein